VVRRAGVVGLNVKLGGSHWSDSGQLGKYSHALPLGLVVILDVSPRDSS
jgi:hypothetical protein